MFDLIFSNNLSYNWHKIINGLYTIDQSIKQASK